MLGFLENLKKRKALRIAEKAAKEDPNGLTWADLAERYMDVGEIHQAYDCARRGMKKFPESDRLAAVYKTIKEEHFHKQVDDLRRTIASKPTPIAFTRLAEVLKTAGEVEESLTVCQEGLEKYPDYGNLHLILGEIFLDRFQAELWEKDLRTAVRCLEQTLVYSRHNYRALILLARTYVDVGLPSRALEKLEAIKFIAPHDEKAAALARRAGAMLETGGDKARVQLDHGDVHEISADTDRLDGDAIDAAVQAGGHLDDIVATLHEFDGVDGIWQAMILDSHGMVITKIGGKDGESHQDDLSGAMLANLYRISSDASVRMDIGRFIDGMIDSDQHRIFLVSVQDCILALFATLETRPGLLEIHIRKFRAAFAEVA